VTEEVLVDVSNMYAAHDTMRKEYASLPLLVKSIPDGDVARAALVADHIALLDRFMRAHHGVEDEVLWPLVKERAPEHEAILIMDTEHAGLHDSLDAIRDQAQAWRASASYDTRATLHTTLIAFERALLKHLGHEEREVLPILARTLTQDEYSALGTGVAERLDADDRALLLGLILEDTTQSVGSVTLMGIPEESRAQVEQDARSRAQTYKRTLLAI
jgi:hemerythrin-like domain-containing protein